MFNNGDLIKEVKKISGIETQMDNIEINIKRFMCNGVSDTQAYINAMNYLSDKLQNTNNHGTLRFPSGVYKITQGYKTDKSISLVGDGLTSIIEFESATPNDTFIHYEKGANSNLVDVEGYMIGVKIDGLYIKSTRKYRNNAIQMNACDHVQVTNVNIERFKGFSLNLNVRESYFANINTRFNGDWKNKVSDVILGHPTQADAPNENKFISCFFIYSYCNLLDLNRCYLNRFTNCMFHNMPLANHSFINQINKLFGSIDLDGLPTTLQYGEFKNVWGNLANKNNFENCTFRIGGKRIILCENNSKDNVFLNSHYGSFTDWTGEINYVFEAKTSSNIIVQGGIGEDTGGYYIFDETSDIKMSDFKMEVIQVNQTQLGIGATDYYNPQNFKARVDIANGGSVTHEIQNLKPNPKYSMYLDLDTVSQNGLVVRTKKSNGDMSNSIVLGGNNTDRRLFAFQNGTYLMLSPFQKGFNISVPSTSPSRTIAITDLGTTDYTVMVTPSWNTTYYITNKTTNSFQITFGSIPSTNQALDYVIIL